MYSASADFNTKIKLNERQFEYSGTITTVGGDTYTYDGGDIRSGKIVRAISGDSLEIGTVYAAEYDVDLGLSISRYELYGATIDLNIQLVGAADLIPMGIFTISEVTQTRDRLHIKAYDNMVLFDKVQFTPQGNTNIKSPYVWLSEACTACGVVLGTAEADIRLMPNGRRNTGYADVAADVQTWRDVLGYIAAYLGAYTYIGRDGKLYLAQYDAVSDDTVSASFRYTSNLSDFQTTYNGINATYKDGGLQEYAYNENATGLVLDLGTNPFLQFTNSRSRMSAMQAIIDTWNDVYYVPFEADMPLIPIYDAGDVLTFTGNQATANDIGVITEITYTIGGQMRVVCSGDNPLLAKAQDRFTKAIAGLNYTNGQEIGNKEFWIIGMTNAEQIVVSGTEVQVAEIEYQQTTYGQQIEMVLTIDATLSATAVVDVRVNVDDDVNLEMIVTEKRFAGERVFHCSNPQVVTGKQKHKCKVYMKVTDSPTLIGDLY